MAKPSVEVVSQRYILGEGPHWDHNTQKLYFVDIMTSKICRLDPETGVITTATLDCGTVGFVIPVEGMPGKLVAGADKSLVLVTWDGETNVEKAPTSVLANVDADRGETRWNDGKVDSSGRLWAGTMGVEQGDYFPPNQGSLYSVTNSLTPKKEVSPVTISNGLAWSLQNDTMYYIDSVPRQIYGFDYDSKTGAISNKRVVFDLEKASVKGLPDGMTIDTDGNLWVALFTGGAVIQVNPQTGKVLNTVAIPAERVTSVAFGGPNFDVLYVTTATVGMKEAELQEQPHAGCVFVVKGLGARGLKANSFKL